MTCVQRRIPCLLKASQYHIIHHFFFRPAFYFSEQRREVFRLVPRATHRAAQRFYISKNPFHLLSVWLFVYPVKGRRFEFRKIFRNSLVCRDHKLLNNYMRKISLSLYYCLRPALHIKQDFRFRKVKIKASSFKPLFSQDTAQFGH